MAQVYRIQFPDGQFSTGGTYPGRSKKGKLWASRGALSNHLNLVKPSDYKGCKLVTYELVETVVDEESFEDFIATKAENARKKEAARLARFEEHKRQQREAQYKQLAKEFGPK